jgi:hypothetical protein
MGVYWCRREPMWKMRWRYPGVHSIATRCRGRQGPQHPLTHHLDPRLVVGPETLSPSDPCGRPATVSAPPYDRSAPGARVWS